MELLSDRSAASTAAQRDTLMSDAAEAAAAGSVGHKDNLQPEMEEAVYVLLDLDDLGPEAQLRPGHTIELSGLDTFEPTIKLPDGTTCAAVYEETIGSCMLFGIDDSAAGGTSGGQPVSSLQYMCTSEQLLKVRRAPAQKPP